MCYTINVRKKGDKMLVKDLIKLFSTDTKYQIIYADNPHYICWWGQGSKINIICNDKEIKAIRCDKGKGIIIYI
jgi:hypothetical protein